jgi:hypothetical protein
MSDLWSSTESIELQISEIRRWGEQWTTPAEFTFVHPITRLRAEALRLA